MDTLILTTMWHVRAMWRYRRLGLYTAWSVAVLSAVLVFLIPKKYEASARVFVNTDSILKPLMEGMTVAPDNGQRAAMLSRLLISRPNVQQLIKDTGLAVPGSSVEQQERLLDHVMEALAIESTGEKNNTYVLRYHDIQPQRARQMVALLVAKFIDSNQGGRATDTAAARRFIDEQAAAYEKKLQEADARLREFKLEHMAGMVSEEGPGYLSQMASVKDQLSDAQLQLKEAENTRDAYRRSLGLDDAAAPVPGAGMASEPGAESILAPLQEPVSDVDERIDALQHTIDGLLQKYTESHPDVADARRILAELKEQRRQLAVLYPKRNTAHAPLKLVAAERNTAEQLKVALVQAEAAVASFQTRVAEYAARYSQLHDIGLRMPEYEVQLAQLNRDYQLNKKNYDEFAKRRESASIAGEMQSVAGVGDFRLIDPPRVAPASSLSHAVALAGSLVCALGAGLGAMFLAKEVRARFHDRAHLSEVLKLPVLGVISVVPNAARTRAEQQRLRRLILTGGVLLLAYAGVVIAALLLTKPVL